jgi:hypothetical protein
MCAFQCDSCLHKQVCSDEPNTLALNEECALYANVKKFTDLQQLKAEIAALVNKLESYSRSQEVDNEFWDIVETMRQLSAVWPGRWPQW